MSNVEQISPARGGQWGVGGVLGVMILMVTTAGAVAGGVMAVGRIVGMRTVGNASATLLVHATDGKDVMVWVERDGKPGRAVLPISEMAPGEVAIRVTRTMLGTDLRSDIVRMTLQAGCQNLVVVGDEAVGGVANFSNDARLKEGYFAPGVLSVDKEGLQLMVKEKRPEGEIAALPLQREVILHSAEEVGISADDHVLLVVNPFAEVIECSVQGDGWTHEFALAGPICRAVGIGESKHLRVVSRLAPRGELIEERVLEMRKGLPMYTIGGATVYRWTNGAGTPVEGTPGVAVGPLAFLPEGMHVWLGEPRWDAKVKWLFRAGSRFDSTLGLSAVISNPPVLQGQGLGALKVRPGVTVEEIALPATMKGMVASSVGTDGDGIVGVSDGAVYDLGTGKAISKEGEARVAQVTLGPEGLVLLTADGALATIQDGRIVRGAMYKDPTMKLFSMGKKEAAIVWFYGGLLGDKFLGRGLELGKPPRLLEMSMSKLPEADDSATIASTRGTAGDGDITALASLNNGLLVARGRRIDKLGDDKVVGGESLPKATGKSGTDEINVEIQPVVVLPADSEEPIVGLLEVGGKIYFSTRSCVMSLGDEMAMPVVEGAGGRLYAWRGGILVHDVRTHRLIHLLMSETGAAASKEGVQ